MDHLSEEMTTMKESADDIVTHLHKTHQDTKPITDKVEDIGDQWRQLQAKLKELSFFLGKGKITGSPQVCEVKTEYCQSPRLVLQMRPN
jgi:hypothetical protein